MKQLIVNADDFGLSTSVNRGIIYAHRHGIVTSTTLMANMPGFEDAVAQAKGNPGLGVGVHLNLCRGNPLLPQVQLSSLVDRSGLFWAPAQLLRRIYLRKISQAEVEAEWRAQVSRVQKAGIKVTHLDSEKQFHVFPILDEAFVKVAQYFQIPSVRLPAEDYSGLGFSRFFNLQFYKQIYLKRRALKVRPLLRKYSLRFPAHFFGVMLSGEFTLGNLIGLLKKVPHGVTELMVHPGFVDEKLRRISDELDYHMIESRKQEVNVLTALEVKTILKQLGIQLVHFGSL